MRRLQTRWLRAVLLAAVAAVLSGPAVEAKEAPSKSKSTTTTKLDLNTATEQELEGLPGVGAATAAKIIAGRPYASVAELDKAGVSAKTLAEIKPLVTVHKTKTASTTAKSDASTAQAKEPKTADTTASTKTSTARSSSERVDVNSATEKELEELPGVGPATAQKIIAGRPYASVSELEKAGVSSKTLTEIRPMVTAKKVATSSASTASSASSSRSTAATSSASKSAAPKATDDEEVVARTPPRSGMVWVNTDSKVYHTEGDRWYGKTKKGEFMTESDALKAGYRPVKEPEAKPKE
jgi:DNA uptake protein ComE-like DNA-binding protein